MVISKVTCRMMKIVSQKHVDPTQSVIDFMRTRRPGKESQMFIALLNGTEHVLLASVAIPRFLVSQSNLIPTCVITV